MNAVDSRKAIVALASDQALPILRCLRNGDWTLASQVADALGIHVTTASKHLASLHAAGLLERRDHRSRRPTFAYRLRSPLVRLELDLADRGDASDGVALGSAFMEALLESVDRMGGPRLTDTLVRAVFGTGDWRDALGRRLAASGDARAGLLGLVGDARRSLAEVIGPAAASRLVQMAVDRAGEGRADLLVAVGLSEATG